MTDNPFPSTDLRNNQKEYALQVHIIEKHNQYFPHVLITHVPNRPSDAKDGWFKRMMGVRPGVSDIVMWFSLAPNAAEFPPYCKMHSGVVELKVDSKPSSAQNKFLSAIASLGGHQGVARSWREYYHLLCSWGIKPTEVCTIFDEPDMRGKTAKFKDAYDFYR